ncbi:MAG: hypothetical protein J2P20_07900 [Pseudonocardia sp.]|nr:hypothetical protein [Pseudonocardia sp.]MBO0871884.1 hypothetical protein [Pseudonocardia sp.]
MRIAALFGAVAAAGALVVFAPHGNAYAAAGSFTYTGGDGKLRTSSSPPSGACIPLVGSGPVKNMTDSMLEVYNAPGCDRKSRIATVDSMKSGKVGAFQAVYWDTDN